jgi:phage baseplate assembly protein W
MGELARIPFRYSDFKVDLDPHPLNGDVLVSKNADAVKRAVRNLLLTGTYERRFRPRIGSGLQKYLFENVGPVTAELIKRSIATTIQNYEPRARIESIRVTVTPDNNAYEAVVKFGVVNTPETVTIKEIIRRVR